MKMILTIWKPHRATVIPGKGLGSDSALAIHHQQHLSMSEEEGICLLEATREGLPPGYGASLTDARGSNIRPLRADIREG